MGRRKTIIEDEEVLTDREEESGLFIDPDLQDFINEASQAGSGYRCDLFRYENNKKAGWLATFDNSIPTYTEIATTYGEGSYLRQAYYPSGKGRVTKNLIVRIDPEYTKMIDKPGASLMAGTAHNTDSNLFMFKLMQDSQQQTMALMANMMNTVLTVMGSQRSDNFDLEQINSTFNKMLMGNVQQTRDILNMKAKMELGYEEPAPQPNPLLELAKGALEMFGNKILNGNATTKKIYRDMFAGTPQYSEIMNNLPGFSDAYETLIQEGQDKDSLDTILKTLNLPIPGENFDPENIIALEQEEG